MLGMSIIAIGVVAVIASIAFLTLWVLSLRRIVPPNDVHILTSGSKVRAHGKDQNNSSVYYAWPSWIPKIGIMIEVLPVSNFEIKLQGYEGYDMDKVPFVVDIVAFFRIKNATEAATRVEDFTSLKHQLSEILQGAVRRVLAQDKLENIMLKRSELGQRFTKSVESQLAQWGVEDVKAIELMDIRDAQGETVVFNIMEKKRSFIQMESRVEVAGNMKEAETAEIEADKEVQLRGQEALQAVGERTAEKEKAVGVAEEVSKQEIKEQQRTTAIKEMAVVQVREVTNQEILKEKAVVKADEDNTTQVIRAEGTKEQTVIEAKADKEQAVIRAEGEKEQTVLTSEGNLTEQQNSAKGIRAVGEATAEAETLILLAPVTAQIRLAEEIGTNDNYQSYLQNIENIGAYKTVGVENAKALESSDMKIIVNSGEVSTGMSNIMDLFSSKGGTNIGAMIEAAGQVPGGAALLNKLGVKSEANDTVEEVSEKLSNVGNVNNDTPRSAMKRKSTKK